MAQLTATINGTPTTVTFGTPEAVLRLLSRGEITEAQARAGLTALFQEMGLAEADIGTQVESFMLTGGAGGGEEPTRGEPGPEDRDPFVPDDPLFGATPEQILLKRQLDMSEEIAGRRELFNTFVAQQQGARGYQSPFTQQFVQEQFQPLSAQFSLGQTLAPFAQGFDQTDPQVANYAAWLANAQPSNLTPMLTEAATRWRAQQQMTDEQRANLPFHQQATFAPFEPTRQDALNPMTENIMQAYLNQQFSPFFRRGAEQTLQRYLRAFAGTPAAQQRGGAFGEFMQRGFGGFGGFGFNQ